MPPWISPAAAVASLVLAIVIAVLKLSERVFATRDQVAKMELETAKTLEQLHKDMAEKIADVKTEAATKVSEVKEEAAEKLAKAVEDRRKDVQAVESLMRADHRSAIEAIESRLLTAIKESKEDRKASEAALFTKIDSLMSMVLKPRSGETHAVPRDIVR